MGGEWRLCRLGDVVDINPDSIGPDWPYEHIRYVDISSVGEGAIKESPRRLSLSEAPSRARRLVKAGDTVLSTVRPNRRSMFFVREAVPDMVVSTGFAVLRPRPGIIEPRFLYAIVFDRRFTDYLVSRQQGAAYPAVLPSDIAEAEILLPPLPEQRAIARILGALDDKIELNRQMNETLEAMAQALFKSWFVDFDPVVVNAIKAGNPIPEKFAARAAHYRDNPDALGLPDDILRLFPARFVDSELGPIPEGWEVKHLADAIEIHDSKRIPLNSRERAARQGPYPYYGATGIVDYVDDYLFDGIYVLVGEDGSVIDEKGHPVTQYVWGQFWVNNHAHVLTGDGISNEHLYLILKNTNIRAFVTGAVQPKISQKNLKVIPFVHSGENISRVFASQIAEYFRKIRSINEESRTLADLRDTLLPKLISGELRVPDVEKIMEDG